MMLWEISCNILSLVVALVHLKLAQPIFQFAQPKPFFSKWHDWSNNMGTGCVILTLVVAQVQLKFAQPIF